MKDTQDGRHVDPEEPQGPLSRFGEQNPEGKGDGQGDKGSAPSLQCFFHIHAVTASQTT